MYKIMRKGKKVPKSLLGYWGDYEEARSAVRKWLRKYTDLSMYDVGRFYYGNPSHTDYGFSIKKV